MAKTIFKQIFDGIAAGIMISIGCCVFLGCYDSYRWVGAILFSIGLLAICYKGYSLYTGKIGFILDSPTKETFSALLLGLLGNVIATTVVGIAIQYAIPSFATTARAICEAKLTQAWWQTIIRGTLCGVLMYIAVSVFKEKKSVLGIVFGIPCFILSSFEHSIADMVYFAVGGVYTASSFGFVMLVILGNTIGALILPAMGLVGKTFKKAKPANEEPAQAEEAQESIPQAEAITPAGDAQGEKND